MIDFIEKVVDLLNIDVWLWIFAGVVGLVFVVGIVMMIIKKRAFPVGRSTAIAGIVCADIMGYFSIIATDVNGVYYYTTFIICVGGILALIGGLVSMIVKRKGGKNMPAAAASPEPAAYQYDNIPVEPIVPAYHGGYESAPNYPARQNVILPPDVEALLSRINRICAGGSTLTEMREAASQLQKERAKPENKNNPEVYSRLNKALIELLNAIQKR